MFDLAGEEIVEYRDSMRELGFKKAFSWSDPDKSVDSPWVWHDKTPFPWDRVIEAGAKDGQRHAHADHLISAAERVAQSRKMHRRKFDYDSALVKAGSVGRRMVDKIQRAIGELKR